MKKIPPIRTKFYLKGDLWKVRFLKNPELDGTPVHGFTDAESRTIVLDRALSPEERWRWFLHELGHACFMRLHINQMSVSPDAEECIVDGIAEIFWNMFELKFITARRRK